MILQKTKIDDAYPSSTPVKVDEAFPSVKSYQKRPTANSKTGKSPSKTALNPNGTVVTPQVPSTFRRDEYAALSESPKRRKLNESAQSERQRRSDRQFKEGKG